MKDRETYYDFLRGIAIVMVIAIHTFPSNMTINEFFPAMLRNLLNCAVPLFIAISGYFVSNKSLDTKEQRLKFWKRQIPKVYIPCIIFSLPYFFINIYQSKDILTSLINLIICGYSIYYFIALIIQYYLLLPWLKRCKTSTTLLIGSCIISLVSVSIIAYILYVAQIKLPLILYAGLCPLWIAFFSLGIYIREQKPQINIVSYLILALILLIIAFFETTYYQNYHSGGFGIKPSSFIFSLIIIIILFSENVKSLYKQTPTTMILEFIGKNSFAVYLTHCFVISATTIISGLAEFWILRTAIVLFIDIVLINIAKRIISPKVHQILGL